MDVKFSILTKTVLFVKNAQKIYENNMEYDEKTKNY